MRASRSRAAHRSAGPRSGPHERTSQPAAPSGSGPIWPLRRDLVTSHICHARDFPDSGSLPDGQDLGRAGALGGVGGEFVGDGEPLGAGQLAQRRRRI